MTSLNISYNYDIMHLFDSNKTMSLERNIKLGLIAGGFLLTGISTGCAESVTPNPGEAPVGATPPATQPDRYSSMVATAQSVQTKGETGLAAEGFSLEALRSQRKIDFTLSYNVTVDGLTTNWAGGNPCDSTVVNLPNQNGFLLLTAAHCTDPVYQTETTRRSIEPNYPGKLVTVSNLAITYVHFDNATLARNQVGISTFNDSNVESNSYGTDGLGFIFVPKDKLDAAELAFLESTALPEDRIMFDNPPAGSVFEAGCHPAEIGSVQTVVQNASVISEDSNEMTLAPASVGTGCSGAGVFVKGANGDLLASAIISYHPAVNNGNAVATYKLSGIGREAFYGYVANAQADYNSQPK